MNRILRFHIYYRSPLGLIEIIADQQAILGSNFVDGKRLDEDATPLLERACQQFQEYFAGEREVFDLPLSFEGTPFQRSVWQEVLAIPYGRTVSYSQVAVAIGKPKAVRPVGTANGRNPLSIIVPCHRVIGSDGSLSGYGGGLWRKEWLLDHERGHPR
jgi:O-6-methylguanine DNA methyltransferase